MKMLIITFSHNNNNNINFTWKHLCINQNTDGNSYDTSICM